MLLPILRLIRFHNLAIIILTQLLMYVFVILPFAEANGANVLIGIKGLSFLILSTVLVAAGGYIINDYFDVRIDRINRPLDVVIDNFIERRIAIIAHFILTVAALLIGCYIALRIGKWWLGLVHLLCAVTLWFYSTHFKYRLVTGNIVIAFLTSLVPVTVLLFSFTFNPADGIDLRKPSMIIAGFSLFAFLSTVVREIVKDMEDYEGDIVYGCQTLPVKVGLKNSRLVAVLLTLVIIAMLLPLQYFLLQNGKGYHAGYILFFIQAPFLYFIKKLLSSQNQAAYRACSTIVKMIMLPGILFALMVF